MSLREFVDGDGVMWRAWDTVPDRASTLPPELASGWLTFESHRGRRRLVPIPPGWDLLTDERLELLCRLAELGPPRARAGEAASIERNAARRDR
jgi:hypothetical protein